MQVQIETLVLSIVRIRGCPEPDPALLRRIVAACMATCPQSQELSDPLTVVDIERLDGIVGGFLTGVATPDQLPGTRSPIR